MEGDPERHSINANRAITDGKTLEPKTSLKPKIRAITWSKPGKTPEGGMELWHSVATSGLRILGMTQASLHSVVTADSVHAFGGVLRPPKNATLMIAFTGVCDETAIYFYISLFFCLSLSL